VLINKKSPENQRKDVINRNDEILAAPNKANPKAQDALKKASGYATFSDFGFKIPVFGTGLAGSALSAIGRDILAGSALSAIGRDILVDCFYGINMLPGDYFSIGDWKENPDKEREDLRPH
jgi:hypothetical protein